MSGVSTSVNAMTTIKEIHEKLGAYRILKKQPSASEIQRTIRLLKKYLGRIDKADLAKVDEALAGHIGYRIPDAVDTP